MTQDAIWPDAQLSQDVNQGNLSMFTVFKTGFVMGAGFYWTSHKKQTDISRIDLLEQVEEKVVCGAIYGAIYLCGANSLPLYLNSEQSIV